MTNDLIARLNYIKNWKCNGDSETFKTISDAIIALEQPKPQWIPCSERLPEANGNYLVTCGIFDNRTIAISGYRNSMWLVKTNVHAWMPLPDLYQEGAADETYLGCEDYDIKTRQCLSNGGCAEKEDKG